MKQARDDQEREILLLAAVASASQLVFHYTDPAAAALIWSTKCIRATRGYAGHVSQGDGVYRPSGAYATPFAPWHPMSQSDLKSFLWLKPGQRSVASAVVIRNWGDWVPVTGIEVYKWGPAGSMVPVDAIAVVPNLMSK